jgi:hypothetical protein
VNHLKRDAILSGLFILSAPLVGWGIYRVTHRSVEDRSSTQITVPPAPLLSVYNASPKLDVVDPRDVAHQARMKALREGLADRWDKCIAAHGLPVPGFDGPDADRWGLMCIRTQSVIYINDTAW